MRFNDIEFVKILKKWDSLYYGDILKVYDEVKNVLGNRVPVLFPNYTMHDISHSIRVANYMYKFVEDRIDREDPKKSHISELDIVLMVYGAILHDVGMALSEEELDKIRKNESVKVKDEASAHYDFQLSGVANISRIKNPEDALQEYVRRKHAFQSRVYVENLSKEYFQIRGHNLDFREEVGLLCQSHNETYRWIEKELSGESLKGGFTYNMQFCACLLRLGDILDMDSQRTPMKLYMMINPQGRSDSEWLQHFTIENEEKVFRLKDGKLQVKFIGTCKDPYIHRKIYNYIDYVRKELVGTYQLVSSFDPKYRLLISTEVYRDIKGRGYDVPDYKMSVDYRAVSTLLMGEKIYGDRKIGLRELLQNSIDACKIRQEEETALYKIGDDPYQPSIKIILDKKENRVHIRDNGIGMIEEILQDHFLSIGHSYYQSDAFKLKNFSYQPIGTFGIGFLSCFMLSHHVLVKTCYFKSNSCLELNMEQGEEYFSLTRSHQHGFTGTEIILNYTEVFEVFESTDEICSFIKAQVLTENIEFKVISGEETVVIKTELKDKLEDPDHTKIDVSGYFDGISGYIRLAMEPFICRTFGDLKIGENVFYYDGNDIIDDPEMVAALPISPLVKQDRLNYWYVETDITSEETSNFDFVYILYDNHQTHPEQPACLEELVQNLLSGVNPETINIENRYALFHTSCDSDFVIPFYKQEDKEETNEIEPLYDPIGELKIIGGDNYFYYNKNIAIAEHFDCDYEPVCTGLSSKGVFNLTHKSIEPDVAREHFSVQNTEELIYALSRIKYIMALERFSLEPGKKLIVKSFIDKYFSKKSLFEKNNLKVNVL